MTSLTPGSKMQRLGNGLSSTLTSKTRKILVWDLQVFTLSKHVLEFPRS